MNFNFKNFFNNLFTGRDKQVNKVKGNDNTVNINQNNNNINVDTHEETKNIKE